MPTERRFDRALEEVWEWRAKAMQYYDSLADLSAEERACILNQRADEILKQRGIELPRLEKQQQR